MKILIIVALLNLPEALIILLQLAGIYVKTSAFTMGADLVIRI
jgi:hypothetical protein